MLKYVNTDVVFQEIPDEVTLAINISGCPCRCPGCHSRYLWDDVGLPLDTAAIDSFVGHLSSDITCISFMGGDADPKAVNMLAQYIHEEYPALKVAWYTGRIRVPAIVNKADFDYIKVGPYIRHLGSLKDPTTNQRLYRRTDDGAFEDITHRFWKTSVKKQAS
ncbi:MAG: anaerobic ribonucleoside-triphosphate reductase activating protein [Prevotella sp.]|nr:anaerobic ribonucleoside-triphosphate reductase activating protein [Prevotella sp.]